MRQRKFRLYLRYFIHYRLRHDWRKYLCATRKLVRNSNCSDQRIRKLEQRGRGFRLPIVLQTCQRHRLEHTGEPDQHILHTDTIGCKFDVPGAGFGHLCQCRLWLCVRHLYHTFLWWRHARLRGSFQSQGVEYYSYFGKYQLECRAGRAVLRITLPGFRLNCVDQRRRIEYDFLFAHRIVGQYRLQCFGAIGLQFQRFDVF